jgi:hypothetical protein
MQLRRLRFEHPQRDLQRRAVEVTNGHGVVPLTRPRHDFEAVVMERVKWIMNRHGGRHGIQRGCR